MTDVYRLRIPESASVEEMVRRYQERPDVEWAEPNFRMHMATVPNDADYTSEQKWYYDLLSAERAWDHERGDVSVVLAILDSGVDLDHPDLMDKIWTNEVEVPGNGLDDDNNGRVDDVHGWDFVDNDSDPGVSLASLSIGTSGGLSSGVSHGTMVAGIAAAASNNFTGVTGMAWGCSIMSVRVLNPEGTGWTADIAYGITYAAKNGARVINLSLGDTTYSAAVAAAVEKAHDVYGCVVVAAAGNANRSPILYPARLSRVIAVGASDHRDPGGRASFSSWGPEIDVVAPGEDIWSTSVDHRTGAAEYRPGSGTSFSSPLVAGLCGLILSRHPSYTNEQVRDLLKATATDLPDDPDDSPDAGPDWDGAGMVNAYQALRPLGDVTGNDQITAYDASWILRYAVGQVALTGGDSVAADVSGDVGVTPYDASLVLEYVVGRRTTFPVEEGGSFRVVSSEERILRVGTPERMEDGRLCAAIFVDLRDGIVAGEMELRVEGRCIRAVAAARGALPSEYLWAANVSANRIRLAFAGTEPLTGEGPLARVILDRGTEGGDGKAASDRSDVDLAAGLRIERVRLNEGRIPTRLAGTQTEIANDHASAPPEYTLYPNFPNPFNACTRIEYRVPTSGHIRLAVYDVLGRRIETLVDAWRSAGLYAARWDGGNASSGVYFCRLDVEGESFSQVRRMLLVR